MKCRLIYIVSMLILWNGCNGDLENLVSTTDSEFKYSLPQGDHDYDTKIVDWYNRCGFYILYKFEPKDVYFNVNSEWQKARADTIIEWSSLPVGAIYRVEGDYMNVYNILGNFVRSIPMGKSYDESSGIWQELILDGDLIRMGKYKLKYDGIFTVEEADEIYVGEQLSLLEEMFLNHYPDSILSVGIPLKIVLGRNLWQNSAFAKGSELSYWITFNNLLFSHGDESINSLDKIEKNAIKIEMNKWFIEDRIFEKIKYFAELEGFFDITAYSEYTTSDDISSQEYYQNGIVASLLYASLEGFMNLDLKSYIEMIIETSQMTLEAEPQNGNFDSWSYWGILHSKKDVNGLIRKKYDVLIKVFNDIGVDLQAIGDLYND